MPRRKIKKYVPYRDKLGRFTTRKRKKNVRLKVQVFKKPPLKNNRLDLKLPRDQSIKEYLKKLGLLINLNQVDAYKEIKLKDLIPEILRKYSRISTDRYLYKGKKPRNIKSKRIIVYYLVYDEKIGYSIMSIIYKRSRLNKLSDWKKLFFRRHAGYKYGFQYILENNIFEAILENPEYRHHYYFKDVIGWSDSPKKMNRDKHVIQKNNSTRKRIRNKTNKKRSK